VEHGNHVPGKLGLSREMREEKRRLEGSFNKLPEKINIFCRPALEKSILIVIDCVFMFRVPLFSF